MSDDLKKQDKDVVRPYVVDGIEEYDNPMPIATIGILLYVSSMWTAGLTQSLMWMSTTEDGMLKYPQFMETVIAIKPLYWVRLVGGLLYLAGTVMCLYNLYRTRRQGEAKVEVASFVDGRHIEPKTWHERLEGHALALSAGAIVVVIIGGVAEFVPAMMMEMQVPTLSTTRPYTPLELHGRDLYIREGCYNCHSQTVRFYQKEELRYGPASQATEFIYDYPFQWGSKRTGPDLHRLGGKYPHLWHYRHMQDPRSTSPGSIMPAYPWIMEAKVDMDDLEPKLHAMITLGVPYDETTVKDPVGAYQQQAALIGDSLRLDGVQVKDDQEIIAMIAYLQKLGTDLPKAKKEAMQ